ncbi:MAG: BACON domain-containing carbohydrate-binding protein [Bacteroidota bacterium]
MAERFFRIGCLFFIASFFWIIPTAAQASEYITSVDSLSISLEQVVFGHKREAIDLHISTNVNWFITTSAPWINFSKINGQESATVQVSVVTNNSVKERSEYLIINSGDLNDTLVVIQQGQPITLVASPTSLQVDKKNQTFEIQVVASLQWDVVAHDTWISVEKVESGLYGKVKLYINATEEDARTGKVTLGAGDKTVDIIVNQANVITNTVDEILSEINIYPIPARNFFYVDGEVKELVLFDISGKVHIHQNHITKKEIRLNTSAISTGTYFLKLFTTKGIGIRKIILN